MNRGERVKFKKIEHLYRWTTIDSRPLDHPEGERVFLDAEKRFAHLGLRSRLIRTDRGYELQVPLRDEDVARDLYTGVAATLFTASTEEYRLFESDLRLKNPALRKNKTNDRHRVMRIRSILFMVLSLLVMLAAAAFLYFR